MEPLDPRPDLDSEPAVAAGHAQTSGPGSAGEQMPDEFHPRHLAKRLAQLALVIALVAIAITAVPSLDDVRARLANASPIWVVAVIAAEVGSCFGYLLVFRSTFCPTMPWGLSYDIAMSEQAANSLLPTGGAGGLALGVWALRQAGMATGHIARRTVAFFLVTSAANFAGVVVVGLGVFLGILPGGGSPVFTLVPALIAALVIVVAVISPSLLRALARLGADADRDAWRGRAVYAVRAVLSASADGVEQAVALLRGHSFGVIAGSLAYLAFDLAALGFGFAAVGPVPAFGTLVLGYLIGQLGNLVPLPGGVGGTEGALVGMFAIYGTNVTQAAAAVLIYRLFQLAVPAVLGIPAFAMLRRKLVRAHRPASMCAPLAVE